MRYLKIVSIVVYILLIGCTTNQRKVLYENIPTIITDLSGYVGYTMTESD